MWRRYNSLLIGIVAGAAYGLISRLAFGWDSRITTPLSIGFFILVPVVLGFLSVMLATDAQKQNWPYVIMVPWVACMLCMALVLIFQLEILICIVLALPFFIALSSLGGLLAHMVWRIVKSNRGRAGAVVLFAMMPYLAIPLDSLLPLHTVTRRVHSEVIIDAAPEIVWANITDLPRIGDDENSAPFFHRLGLPRPLEAELVCEEVGCTRTGYWEQGLYFDGTITQITPGRSFWLDLDANTSGVAPGSPLKQVGGSMFEMLDDGYEVEPLGDGRTLLRLHGTYRLTTRINGYGGLWIDFLMRDMQRYIIGIEKARSEAQAAQD